MGTIIDYVKEYGDYTFSERPMNDVDSLILCQLSYLKFDGMVSDVREYGPWVTLQALSERTAAVDPERNFDNLFAQDWFEKSNRALVSAMLAGRRYRNLRLNCYVNLVEKEWETQFSAVTFLLDDGTLYIAFRGTDESIVGWKEDFNMAFSKPVPGQLYSVKYLNMVTGRLRGPFYVGGHSKGGNLAVYGAMKCVPEARKNLIKAYSMDGPGFRPEILKEGEYQKLQDKIVKILPHSSLVGMIFERDTCYQVVKSKSFGVAQHNSYNWLVEEGAFVMAEEIYEGRRRRNETLNAWILSLNEEQLRVFVDTLYQVVSAAQADDLLEFAANLKISVKRVLGALREVDDQTGRMLREMVKSFFDMSGARMREDLTPKRSPGVKSWKRY